MIAIFYNNSYYEEFYLEFSKQHFLEVEEFFSFFFFVVKMYRLTQTENFISIEQHLFNPLLREQRTFYFSVLHHVFFCKHCDFVLVLITCEK